MKVLSFSYCYPTPGNQTWGIFVYHRLVSLSQLTELKVCSPVTWFPGLPSIKKPTGSVPENWNGLETYRPGFFYIPKFFKDMDARLYARGLKKWFHNLIQSWKPDILDAHFIWPDGVGVSGLAREFDIPYVITLRGKIYECIKVPSQKEQCAIALRNASRIISVSGLMAEEVVKLGADEKSVRIIPNGIDQEKLSARDKMECRDLLGLPRDKKILVTVAHLGHRKGHHEVIQALGKLSRDIVLVLVGGEAQGGTKEDLMQTARKVGVADRVKIVGPQPFEKVALYFSAADASVLASYREGCPNAVLESLGCGTPVIASRVGAVPDILPVPDAGRIVPPKAIEPLAQAIDDVLNNDWNPLQVKASANVQSWEQVAQKVYDTFQEIVV